MIDDTNYQTLSKLQNDVQLTSQELSQKLNPSQSQAGLRRQRLKREGYIKSYHAEVSAEKLGLEFQAFLKVQFSFHSPALGTEFTRTVSMHPRFAAAWRLTGEADYLLRVYCEDLKTLNFCIEATLIFQPAVSRVQSQIVMEQAKPDSPLPTR